VLPRYSTFLGREDDDWQLDASRPLVEEPGVLTAALTSLEDPQYKGTLTVSTETYTITSVDLGHMVQTLAITRTEPSEDDLDAPEDIKPALGAAADPDARAICDLLSQICSWAGRGRGVRRVRVCWRACIPDPAFLKRRVAATLLLLQGHPEFPTGALENAGDARGTGVLCTPHLRVRPSHQKVFPTFTMLGGNPLRPPSTLPACLRL
jgi:hypothetical protein